MDADSLSDQEVVKRMVKKIIILLEGYLSMETSLTRSEWHKYLFVGYIPLGYVHQQLYPYLPLGFSCKKKNNFPDPLIGI